MIEVLRNTNVLEMRFENSYKTVYHHVTIARTYPEQPYGGFGMQYQCHPYNYILFCKHNNTISFFLTYEDRFV